MQIAAVDTGELARFICTGVTAALVNIASAWLARFYWPFEAALLAGMAAGLTISFFMSKWLAFRTRSWDRVPGEMVRFLLVYALGCALCWVVAVVAEQLGRARGLGVLVAEALGFFIGAGAMAVTSYLGHRFFTFRTNQRHASRFGSTL